MSAKIRSVALTVILLSAFIFSCLAVHFHSNFDAPHENWCYTGAFLADSPGADDIRAFEQDYGKKPYYVMMFVDWPNFPDAEAVEDVLKEGSVPIITWEPWIAYSREPVDISAIISGEYDGYIREFSRYVGGLGEEVLLRFAHEMNGDWYPWAGVEIGARKYVAMYRHIKDVFDEEEVTNVRWVFSVNWEDIPASGDNSMFHYYPGDEYVDYIGLDGYNWGTTEEWSSWMSFYDIFHDVYREFTERYGKPVIITEFSSASEGGDKAMWIREAMYYIKKWENIKGFVIFNVIKETDWTFPIDEASGKELRYQLEDPHFRDRKYSSERL